jgi:LPXTG-motif cell wall-anchored protein
MTTTAAQPATTTTAAQGPGATWGAGTKKSADAQARDHLARTASDPGVSIVDYSFSPGSITIQQGDTITWVNNGKQPHTATASNGSFDTGTLKPGASASHTFSTAGTFAYICSIHPFMHGTVVVQAASSTPSSSGSSGSSTSGTSSGASTTPSTGTTAQAAVPVASGPSLPNTGLNLIASMIAAMVLVAAGVVLRRRSRA